MLPRSIRPEKPPRAPNRTGRWKSTAHRDFVRGHACSVCGAMGPIEVAHIRNGTDGGMARKPSDYWTVSLCKPCHDYQHTIGEPEFWKSAEINPKALAMEFAKASPRWPEIRKRLAEAAG